MSTAHIPAPPVRLRLREPVSSKGFVDGAWWPHDRSLVDELPGLIEAMLAAGVDVRRVSYNRGWWADTPRRMVVGGQLIRLGSFEYQDELMIGLVDVDQTRRRDLLVVPPETDPELAEAALAQAAEAGGLDRPADFVLSGQAEPSRSLRIVG